MLHARILRYLDTVARLGSIRRAAGELNVASSAINRQIIALELDIGEPIFERMPRKLRLTATGELLIQHIRETLKAHQETMRRIDALRGLKWGSVSLAASLGLAGGPLAAIIAEYVTDHPRMSVRVSGAITDAIAAAVHNGEVTLGLAYGLAPRAGLRTIFAAEVPLGVLVAPGHPLASSGAIKLQNILEYPMVMAEPGMSLRAATDLALSRFAEVPVPVLETNSVELVRNFVAKSQAVALLNPLDVANDIRDHQLLFLPLNDESLHPQTLQLVCRTRDALDVTVSHFAQFLTTRLLALVEDLTQQAE